MTLSKKTAVITGVSKGIGKALCKQLLAKNCFVFGLGQNEPDFNHPNFMFIKTDVRDFEQLQQAFEIVLNRHNKTLDIVINNAGLGYFGYLEDMSLEHYHEIMRTNVDGIFYCCKLSIPILKQKQSGHIINISSIAGLEAYPQVSAYSASKFAVKGFSEALYKELRDFGIKVTCIYPGSVKTDFFRNSPGIKAHDYMLMPEEVAQSIVQILETSGNFHVVNHEIRPLQPKGPKN